MISTKLITKYLEDHYPGVYMKETYGEISFFYNPDMLLKNGVYFCTIKTHDGPNDHASKLDREDVYRLSTNLSKNEYETRFGIPPKRANKGEIVALDIDFSTLNQLMPHPIYAWMRWVQVLSPSEETFKEFTQLLNQRFTQVQLEFIKKTKIR